MQTEHLVPEFVDLIPDDLRDGVLYVSMTYGTTVHLCASGCGNKVVLPLSPADWQLFYDGDAISLTPSVGNWQYPCRSHYWIRENRILTAKPWTWRQVEEGRRRDVRDLQTYLDRRATSDTIGRPSLRRRLLRLLRRTTS